MNIADDGEKNESDRAGTRGEQHGEQPETQRESESNGR